MFDWKTRTVLLGVTAGLSIHRSVYLASRLSQLGAKVDVLMTPGAEKYITRLMFASVTQRDVYLEQWLPDRKTEHISLAERPDIVVVAPASANTIAKMAMGVADNLLTSTMLATAKPILIATEPIPPKGLGDMMKSNLDVLVGRGAFEIFPMSNEEGLMAKPEEIITAMEQVLSADAS